MSFLIKKILDYFNQTTCKILDNLWIDDDSEELNREAVLLRENILENEAENELNIESELPVIEEDFYNEGLKLDQIEVQEFKLNDIHNELPQANDSLLFQNPNCETTFTTEDVNSDKEVYGNEDKTNAFEDVIQVSEKPPTDSEESAIQDGRESEIEINNEMLTIKVYSAHEHNLVEDDETTPNIRILDLECLKDDDDTSIPPWMHWRNPEDTNHCEDEVTGERSDTSKVDDNSPIDIDKKEKSSYSLNYISFNASISSEESQSASPCIQPKFPSSRNLPPIVPTFQRRHAHPHSIVQPISNYFSRHHPQKQNDEFSEVKINDSLHQDDHKQNLDSFMIKNFFHQNSTLKESKNSYKNTKNKYLNQKGNINEFDKNLCFETTTQLGNSSYSSPQIPEILFSSLAESEKRFIFTEKEDIYRGLSSKLPNNCNNGRSTSLVSSLNDQSLPSLEVMRKEATKEFSIHERNKEIDASYFSNFATKTIKVYQNKSKKRNKSFIANVTRMDNKEDWIPEKKEKILPNLMSEKEAMSYVSGSKIKKPGTKPRFISTYPGGNQRVPFINKF